MIGGRLGEVVAVECRQGEAVLATARDGPFAREVLKKADHEHLEVDDRIDPGATSRAGVLISGAADLANLRGEIDRMEGLVKFAVEGPRCGCRKMVPNHPELPLLQGLRVALLKHAPIYRESLTWEGFSTGS